MTALSRTSRRARWFAAVCGLLGALGASDAQAARVHEVEKGHSLWSIARRYGVTVDALRQKNGLGEKTEIRPGQKLEIPDAASNGSGKASQRQRAAEPSSEASAKPSVAWYLKKPPSATQTQKAAKDRGVNPCNTPDPGPGIYGRWSRAPLMGQMISPERGGIAKNGAFDVMVHFHGHEPVRKEWVRAMDGAVLVGIDLGIGSGPYEAAFAAPNQFEKLIESVERAMASKTGNPRARARKIGLSGWSAGYGAVQRIISQPYGKRVVDSVVLLDGLHSGYTGNSLNELQLAPFIDYARSAAERSKLMFVSHSSIIPPGYASTTETANFLIWKVGGKPRTSRPRGSDPMGLDLISRYSRGSFHVRGYMGNDKMDHCAHIGLYKDVLKVHVKPRWRSPRGYAKK
jgi:murein DD-endopeptidase MepM/ murein hydrolase activator NlpD